MSLFDYEHKHTHKHTQYVLLCSSIDVVVVVVQ